MPLATVSIWRQLEHGFGISTLSWLDEALCFLFRRLWICPKTKTTMTWNEFYWLHKTAMTAQNETSCIFSRSSQRYSPCGIEANGLPWNVSHASQKS
mmetsp:Transcript_16464/g.27207  ORF Transcript_16464/g.27207 Transcript_16464/m.27207 type:complete len:97 (-) Transcript_16464:532-822(-)